MDYAESYYPMLGQIVLGLSMPSDLANESKMISKFDEELGATPTHKNKEYEEDILDRVYMLEERRKELESLEADDEDSADDG